ncbi:MAG TPA: BMP family ABC transporter substrate-binding protein [Candidatus Dormibacteraeota bacterium]
MGMRYQRGWRGLAVGLAMIVLAGCGGTGSNSGQSSRLKVAFMSTSPANDGGWSQVAFEGMQAMLQTIGSDKVEATFVPSVPYSTQLTDTANHLIAQGYNVLVDDIGARDFFYKACQAHPTVKCEEVSGTEPFPSANIHGFYADLAFPSYMVGEAAGLLTKTGTVGYLAPFTIPIVNSGLNAFALGCQHVRPDCKVRVVVTNSWYAPPQEVEAANSLVAAGADFLWGQMDDTSLEQVATQKNVWVAGMWKDQNSFAPNNYATGVVLDWNAYTTEMVKAVLDGTWTGGTHHLIAPGHGANLGAFGAKVPADVQARIKADWQAIIDGSNPFTGPILDQKGATKVASNDKLSHDYLTYQWDWIVKGVITG